MSKSKRVNITMSQELHTALMEFAGPEHGSAAFIMRLALQEYLANRGIEVKSVHAVTRGGLRPGAGRPKEDNEGDKEEENE